MYDEDPEILAYLEEWTAPTKVHTPDVAGNFDPVPAAYLRGLPEMQTQHTCILLDDVTEACNLRCPTCFTESGPIVHGIVPVEEVLANVDQRLARENGQLDVVMLSGGEPTVHPGLAELLDERAAARSGPGQQQRAHDRARRRAARPARPATANGSRSTCSSTVCRPRRRATTGGRSALLKAARSALSDARSSRPW